MIIPDGKDIRSLKLFFEENEGMTTAELAQLSKVTIEVIRRWKRKAGIKLNQSPFKKKQRPERRQPLPRDVWNNRDWFYQTYIEERLGTSRIGKLIGKDNGYVYFKLKQFKIDIRPYIKGSSPNPCCNKDWLIQHYEVEGLNLKKCAKIAGVTPYTITRWLVKFDIYIRSSVESNHGDKSALYGKRPQVI